MLVFSLPGLLFFLLCSEQHTRRAKQDLLGERDCALWVYYTSKWSCLNSTPVCVFLSASLADGLEFPCICWAILEKKSEFSIWAWNSFCPFTWTFFSTACILLRQWTSLVCTGVVWVWGLHREQTLPPSGHQEDGPLVHSTNSSDNMSPPCSSKSYMKAILCACIFRMQTLVFHAFLGGHTAQ